MVHRSEAARNRQKATNRVIGHWAIMIPKGESAGMLPLELVSQVEVTLTISARTTATARKAVSFQRKRQSRTHQGSDLDPEDVGTCCCVDTTGTPSFNNYSSQYKTNAGPDQQMGQIGGSAWLENEGKGDVSSLVTKAARPRSCDSME